MLSRIIRGLVLSIIIIQLFLLPVLIPIHLQAAAEVPVGIVEKGFGINGSYSIKTTQWLGVIIINDLHAISNLSFYQNWISFQLNVVLTYTYNKHNYALWVQNVFQIDTSPSILHRINFESAIWNFSDLNNITGLSGNGKIYDNCCYLFLAFSNPNSAYLTLPTIVYLLVNVSTNSLGQPVIYFWYNIGNGWVNYDTVTITNVRNSTNVYFLVAPYGKTPAGYPYDAELVLAGIGNGANAYIISSNVTMGLFYWNGHNFQIVPNPLNSGGTTAESVSNAIVKLGYISSILPAAVIVTGGNLTTQYVWTELNNSQVTIFVPNSASGYVILYNDSLPYSLALSKNQYIKVDFVNGEVTLTVRPMLYRVLVYSSDNNLIGNITIEARAGNKVSYVFGFPLITIDSEGRIVGYLVNLISNNNNNLIIYVPVFINNGSLSSSILTVIPNLSTFGSSGKSLNNSYYSDVITGVVILMIVVITILLIRRNR